MLLNNILRRVNLRGVFLGCKFACAQFLKQDLDSNGRRGWIVNTASMLGLVGISGGAGGFYFQLKRMSTVRTIFAD